MMGRPGLRIPTFLHTTVTWLMLSHLNYQLSWLILGHPRRNENIWKEKKKTKKKNWKHSRTIKLPGRIKMIRTKRIKQKILKHPRRRNKHWNLLEWLKTSTSEIYVTVIWSLQNDILHFMMAYSIYITNISDIYLKHFCK